MINPSEAIKTVVESDPSGAIQVVVKSDLSKII